jgi:hypothetical protein
MGLSGFADQVRNDGWVGSALQGVMFSFFLFLHCSFLKASGFFGFWLLDAIGWFLLAFGNLFSDLKLPRKEWAAEVSHLRRFKMEVWNCLLLLLQRFRSYGAIGKMAAAVCVL